MTVAEYLLMVAFGVAVMMLVRHYRFRRRRHEMDEMRRHLGGPYQ